MSLQTYQEARPWARSIRDRVASRNMPPWHIDPNVGIQHYKNDRSLTQKEIDTIVKWAGNGAPQGDPKDMPKAMAWANTNGWNYAKQFGGPPDLVIKSPKYTEKGGAMDAWYKPVVDVPITEPRWVRAIEMRTEHDQGPQDHPSRARVPAAGREGSRRAGPDQRRQRQRRRPLHGMGRQQGRRNDAPEHRQAVAAGLEDPLGHPLQRRW